MYTKLLAEISKNDVDFAGGKAVSLGEMLHAGFSIPSGYVITTYAFKDFASKSLSPDFINEVLRIFDILQTERVAVRSSATLEDSANASWAGQLESYLNISKDGLITAIQKCWQSVFTPRAIVYAKKQQVTKGQLAVAVIIQKMINSEISGVIFTANPINKKDEMVIEAGYGLGEMIVQGMIIPDNYVVDRKSLEIKNIVISEQEKMLVVKNKKQINVSVPKNLRTKQKLTNEQIKELTSLGMQIEKYFGKPQDIEWCWEDGKLWIVQSRPITTL